MKATSNKIKRVFFDLDGTLADSLPSARIIYERFLTRFGAVPTTTEFDHLNGPSLPEVVSALKKNHSLAPTEEELLATYKSLFRKIYISGIEEMPGATKMLAELHGRGLKIAITTSGPRETASVFIKKMNWDVFVDFAVYGDDVIKSKPEPEIYLTAIQRAGVEPHESIAVEDAYHGVKAASTAGALAIGFSRDGIYERLFEAGASHVIKALPELPGLIEKIQNG